MRARILAGVATLVVVCALTPTPASAQLLGTCPGLTPPPCIITDPGRIAGTVAELKEKKQQLESAVQQVKEYTTLNGALGRLGVLPADVLSSITPADTQAFKPLSQPTQKIAISQASNALDTVLSSYPQTAEGKAQAEREHRLRLRAAGGEGYALATATKYKLDRMTQEAHRLTDRMQALDNGAAGTDSRGNWALNQGARRLVFDSLLALREVQTARLQLASLHIVPTTSGFSSTGTRAEAPAAQPVQSPEYAQTLGELANTSNKLAALLSAKQLIGGFQDGIQGARDTKAEYEQMKLAASQAQLQVEYAAASDARRKGVPAATLLGIANQYMQTYDRTTWDDPGKIKAAERAAKGAEKALDKRVKGDANNNWSNYLQRRAEAYKQEAFFRPIAADADAMEKQTIQALAEYEQSLGVRASDPATIDAAIAAARAELNQLQAKLAQAPSDVAAKANQILSTSGIAEAGQPLPPPVQDGTPDWARQYANY